MKKLLATLLVSTMALSAFGGLVACGGEEEFKPQNSDFYIVGSSAGSLFTGTAIEGWNIIGNKEDDGTGNLKANAPLTRKELDSKLFFKTTKKAGVYTMTVDLYKADVWCICDAKAGEASAVADGDPTITGWDNQIKFELGGVSHGVEDEYMKKGPSENGGQRNFVVQKSGKYTITYDAHAADEEDIEIGMVTWKRVGDAAKINMVQQDFYIKGNVSSISWGHNWGLNDAGEPNGQKFNYIEATGVYELLLTVSTDDAAGYEAGNDASRFGLARYDLGANTGDGAWMDYAYIGEEGDANDKFVDAQVKTGENGFQATEAGTYTIKVKFDGAWCVDFYAGDKTTK